MRKGVKTKRQKGKMPSEMQGITLKYGLACELSKEGDPAHATEEEKGQREPVISGPHKGRSKRGYSNLWEGLNGTTTDGEEII